MFVQIVVLLIVMGFFGLFAYHSLIQPDVVPSVLYSYDDSLKDSSEEIAIRNLPSPIPMVDATDVAELVKKDIELRVQHGEEEYGQRLHPFNGRDALIDAYQEVLDLAMYLRQAIYEAQHDKN